MAREIIRTGTDVIFDYGCWTKSCRQEWNERALEFADRVIIHNVKCEIDIARKRCTTRTQSNDKELFVCADAFDAMLANFELLSDDEGFEVVTYENN